MEYWQQALTIYVNGRVGKGQKIPFLLIFDGCLEWMSAGLRLQTKRRTI